jgi:hypothetical protein
MAGKIVKRKPAEIVNIDEGDVNADWIKLANPTAQKQELAIHAALAKQFAQEEGTNGPAEEAAEEPAQDTPAEEDAE